MKIFSVVLGVMGMVLLLGGIFGVFWGILNGIPGNDVRIGVCGAGIIVSTGFLYFAFIWGIGG